MSYPISIEVSIGSVSLPQGALDANFFFVEARADGYTVENTGCITNELLRLDLI